MASWTKEETRSWILRVLYWSLNTTNKKLAHPTQLCFFFHQFHIIKAHHCPHSACWGREEGQSLHHYIIFRCSLMSSFILLLPHLLFYCFWCPQIQTFLGSVSTGNKSIFYKGLGKEFTGIVGSVARNKMLFIHDFHQAF